MRNCHKWGQKLVRSGYRLTLGREAIITVLSNTKKHLSVEDIYMVLHPDYPGIGVTTIYRTLDLLEQTGIVRKFEFGHGRAKFELSEEYGNKKHHHHLICNKCKKIIDYSDFLNEEVDYIKKAEDGLRKKYGYEISNHLIRFYGICPACKAG